MKKSDIDALKSAFNIPRPQKKDEFTALYKEKLKSKSYFSFRQAALRYGAAAAIAAVVIGVWSGFDQNSRFEYEFSRDSVIGETTSPSEAYTEPTAAATSVSVITEALHTETTAVTTSASSETAAATTVYTPHAAVGSETVTSTETTVITTQSSTMQTTAPLTSTTAITATTTTASTAVSTTVTTAYTTVTATAITTTTTPEPPSSSYNDFTVTPTVTYEKTDDAFDLRDLNDSMGGTEPPSTGDNPTGEIPGDIMEMAQNSDYIVYGTVDEIIYTDIEGEPFTQEIIIVYSSYKGKLGFMDKISVYQTGGYMPAEKYMEYIGYELYLPDGCTAIYDSGGNNGVQNVGDMFVFFIRKSDTKFPESSFVLTEKTDISVFRYENGSYVSLGDETLSFDLSDLIGMLG